MAGPTLSQQVHELRVLSETLRLRVELIAKEVVQLTAQQELTRSQVDPIIRDWSKTLDRLDRLEKAGDRLGTRFWDTLKLLLAAAAGGLVTYLVKR